MDEPTAADYKSSNGAKRIFKAAGHSLRGLVSAWQHEAAFRQELALAAVLLPLAFWLQVSVPERIALIGALALVLIVELLNSAVETAIDRIGEEHHELSGRAKDMGSAAVFIAMLMLVGTWLAILGPRYIG